MELILQIFNWIFMYHFWRMTDNFEPWSVTWLSMIFISAANGAAIMCRWML